MQMQCVGKIHSSVIAVQALVEEVVILNDNSLKMNQNIHHFVDAVTTMLKSGAKHPLALKKDGSANPDRVFSEDFGRLLRLPGVVLNE
jgi:nitrogen-specific signal transduction histidine kinase